MHFTLDLDEMSESVKESVEWSGDVLFVGVFWKHGCALDMILQAVDSEGNVEFDRFGFHFHIGIGKIKEQRNQVSFVFTVTGIVVILPEVYSAELNIDCFGDLSGVCETISSDDHCTNVKGGNVWVEESAGEIKVHLSVHCERPEQSWEYVVDGESEMARDNPWIRRQGNFFLELDGWEHGRVKPTISEFYDRKFHDPFLG